MVAAELLEAQKMSPADEDIKKALNLLQQQASLGK